MAALLHVTPEDYCAMEDSTYKGFTACQQEVLLQYYRRKPDSFEDLLVIWSIFFEVLEREGRGEDVYRHLWDSAFTLHERIADALAVE